MAAPNSSKRHVLILGGTAEAAALAEALDADLGARVDITTSLAGRTRAPRALPGHVRTGGFGGAGGLAQFLTANRVSVLVDATHPFAAEISANAAAASAVSGVPRLVLGRPEWVPRADDNWHFFDTCAAAAFALPRFGRRAFLTIGAQEIEAFAPLADMWFLVRLIERPTTPLALCDYKVVAGRGPFSEDQERKLMTERRIDVLVSKASGGAATAAKLDAARQLGLPVVMIRRPPAPEGPTVYDVGAAVDWVRDRLAS